MLSDVVANKIAAGEVVDRPASVAKELLENALDAGAGHIEMELAAGGRKLVAVTDDGAGMTRDDAILSIERHATSKIRDVDDIESIATMGFRGEALAAIASVSRFRLTTRSADAVSGTAVRLSGGKLLDVEDAGCPVGTRVEVRNLFFNVPARRKFLRTQQTELSHCRQVFFTYAVACPSAGMRLVVDEREVYNLPGGVGMKERLRALYDSPFVEALRPVEYAEGPLRVSGFAGLPALHRGDRSGQYLFVNGRPAGAPLVSYAVREAYETLVPKGRHPVLFLFIEMPPDWVDVNVHPTKKEVRFRKGNETRDAVIGALRTALKQDGGAVSASREIPFTRPQMADRQVRIEGLPVVQPFQYPRLPLREDEGEKPSGAEAGHPPAEAAAKGDSPWAWCRVLGQVGGLYVVMETEDGLVLMDPHAAHERVLYEKFMEEVKANRVRSQGLLAAESVDLPPADALRVRKNMKLLCEMGFGLSEFGGDTFIVDALPTCLGNVSARSVLVDVADSLEKGGQRGGTERWAEDAVAMAACKAAVKAQDRLRLAEIEQLVVDLAKAEMPYTCPHGRPTLIFLGFGELRRKFGRS